jgi:hypothetical protein
MRQWAHQADEVLFVVDLHRSSGRFAEGWSDRLPGVRHLIEELCEIYPHAHSVDVDYSAKAQEAVGASFFDGQRVPVKDYRGGPFYSYFFGLFAASHELVFHMDSDMLFGGGSATWLSEAKTILESRRDVLACNPLPGPPTEDGALRSQVLEREASGRFVFRAQELSSRLFLLDRRRLRRLEVVRASARRSVAAWMEGNPPFPVGEAVMTRFMASSGLVRLDFLGNPPGMWSVHPPYRSPSFYQALPAIVRAIETDDLPDGQRGCHDIEDCMVDWSDVRPSAVRRVGKHLRQATANVVRAVSSRSRDAVPSA